MLRERVTEPGGAKPQPTERQGWGGLGAPGSRPGTNPRWLLRLTVGGAGLSGAALTGLRVFS